VLPGSDTRVPVVLVVGPLGAGKTQTAARLLWDASRFKNLRVLVLLPSETDFRLALQRLGGPGLDDDLPRGCEVVEVHEEVSGGCVCCTVRRDIEDVLADEVLTSPPSFELVIIDTTAASDPMPVIATLFEEHANEVVTPEVSQCFHLDSVICVLDGPCLDYLGETVHDARQLAFADVVVVTRHNRRRLGSSASSSSGSGGKSHAVSTSRHGGNRVLEGLGWEAGWDLPASIVGRRRGRRQVGERIPSTKYIITLPQEAQEQISGINPLVHVKALPHLDHACRGNTKNESVVKELVGFNTFCAGAFDRLDLTRLRAPRPELLSPSGVMTTVVYAEGRLMQRRFRDCMSALLRLCKENIFRMRGELCYAETEDARWLFHAVHSVVTISESDSNPWAPGEKRVNLLVVTGHDLPISELYACLRMSLIEEAEKSAEAMAQALLAELDAEEGSTKDGSKSKGKDGTEETRSKKAKKKGKEKKKLEAKERRKRAEEEEKERQRKEQEASELREKEALRARLLEERKLQAEEQAAWQHAEELRLREEHEARELEAAAVAAAAAPTSSNDGDHEKASDAGSADPSCAPTSQADRSKRKKKRNKKSGATSQSPASEAPAPTPTPAPSAATPTPAPGDTPVSGDGPTQPSGDPADGQKQKKNPSQSDVVVLERFGLDHTEAEELASLGADLIELTFKSVEELTALGISEATARRFRSQLDKFQGGQEEGGQEPSESPEQDVHDEVAPAPTPQATEEAGPDTCVSCGAALPFATAGDPGSLPLCDQCAAFAGGFHLQKNDPTAQRGNHRRSARPQRSSSSELGWHIECNDPMCMRCQVPGGPPAPRNLEAAVPPAGESAPPFTQPWANGGTQPTPEAGATGKPPPDQRVDTAASASPAPPKAPSDDPFIVPEYKSFPNALSGSVPPSNLQLDTGPDQSELDLIKIATEADLASISVAKPAGSSRLGRLFDKFGTSAAETNVGILEETQGESRLSRLFEKSLALRPEATATDALG